MELERTLIDRYKLIFLVECPKLGSLKRSLNRLKGRDMPKVNISTDFNNEWKYWRVKVKALEELIKEVKK